MKEISEDFWKACGQRVRHGDDGHRLGYRKRGFKALHNWIGITPQDWKEIDEERKNRVEKRPGPDGQMGDLPFHRATGLLGGDGIVDPYLGMYLYWYTYLWYLSCRARGDFLFRTMGDLLLSHQLSQQGLANQPISADLTEIGKLRQKKVPDKAAAAEGQLRPDVS